VIYWAVLSLDAAEKGLKGIGVMTMEDVQRFLDEVCGFLEKKQEGV